MPAVKKASPKKRPSKKKAVAKKAPPKKRATAKKVPSRRPAKKVTAPLKKAAVKKAVAKKTTSKGVGTGNYERPLDQHGFVVGSDSSKIAEILVAGGKDRLDINAKVEKKIGGVTRNDTDRNIPALVSGVLNKLVTDQGYKIDSSFALVPPARRRRK